MAILILLRSFVSLVRKNSVSLLVCGLEPDESVTLHSSLLCFLNFLALAGLVRNLVIPTYSLVVY